MDFLANISNLGWVVIAFIAALIFVVVMFRGIKLGRGDKHVFIGKQIDERLEAFKKEIEVNDLKRLHDEELRKSLHKRSLKIDEQLMADMRKKVRRIDIKVAKIFEAYKLTSLLITVISSLIKDELNERLDYNNVKVNLSLKEKKEYCLEILSDVKDRYNSFYANAGKLSAVHAIPEWEKIKVDIEKLIFDWGNDIVQALDTRIKEKIEMYKTEKPQFKTEKYIKNSITDPIAKNKKYIEALTGEKL